MEYKGEPVEQLMQSAQTSNYKNYTIVCSATHDTTGFIPTAAIMWHTKRGTPTTYFLRLSKVYLSEEDAGTAAAEEAKSWIDKQPPL